MRALHLKAPEQWGIEVVPEPTPREDEVVIRVSGCGICGTDLHSLSGGNPLVRFPAIPGHEFGGTVTAVGGGVSWLSIGDRVVVDPSRYCGHCSQCRSGHPNLCPDKGGYGSRFPGGFAEQASVRATSCEKIPDSMSWEVALMVEPLACVLHGVDRLGDDIRSDAVVVGAGPIGLLTALALRHKGVSVSVVEKSEVRMEVARRMGFEEVVESVSLLKRPTASTVVDATGVPAAIEDGFGLLDRGGKMLFMGVAKAGSRVSLDPHRINWQELTILGSTALNYTFGRALDLLGHIGEHAEMLVTHKMPLEDFGQALDLLRTQSALKILIQP
jgi:threonine dehydrogenase-like Zn-dependent dehydrogenase